MKSAVLVIFLTATSGAFAQSSVPFQDCTGIRVNVFTFGDSLVITCDTAYILNAITFRLYDDAYREVRRKAPSFARFMTAYDEIIALQDRRLREQETAYRDLRASFEALTAASGTTFERASGRLDSAMQNLDLLRTQLQESNQLLTETRAIIEAERRGLNLGTLLWGAGGLTAGLVLGVLISR